MNQYIAIIQLNTLEEKTMTTLARNKEEAKVSFRMVWRFERFIVEPYCKK